MNDAPRGTHLTALAILGLAVLACDAAPPPVRARLRLESALGGPAAEGFARAVAPRAFAFPADHGPHPEFRTEWWYVTGNLEGGDGRHFGYQLTFFRDALQPGTPARSSAWAARDLWMAHLAVSDVAAARFHAHERFARGALELAGARGGAAGPLQVWVGPWELAALPEEPATPTPTLRLRAAEGAVALDLELRSSKPPALQGESGLSRKSDEPGNASYYYSLTRLATHGTVAVAGTSFAVRGTSWLDREWSTSALGAGQVGWDWFALQLDDGSELMAYLLRERGGGTSRWSAGSWIAPDGAVRSLASADLELTVTDRWRSPRGGRYPAAWLLRVPALALELAVEPWLADQELDLAIRYWEGAVRLRGTRAGATVRGSGYVELTGYAE